MSMDRYVRDQSIANNLIENLKDLDKQRQDLLQRLFMIEKMIEKHETYLDELEGDKND